MKNHLKKIMLEAGRKSDIDNRSHYVKNVNIVLETGLVKISVVNSGKLKIAADGVKYNLKVIAANRMIRKNLSESFDACDILRVIGNMLNEPIVKEQIKSSVFIADKCQKCGGRGIIPYFHYYCSGICFDCLGLGFDFKNKTSIQIAKQL